MQENLSLRAGTIAYPGKELPKYIKIRKIVVDLTC